MSCTVRHLREQLTNVKAELDAERRKRKILEEELEQIRREGNPVVEEKITKIKIMVFNQNPMDDDEETIERIKKQRFWDPPKS